MEALRQSQMDKMERYMIANCLDIFDVEEIDMDEVLFDGDERTEDEHIWNAEYNSIEAKIVYNLKTKKISHRR